MTTAVNTCEYRRHDVSRTLNVVTYLRQMHISRVSVCLCRKRLHKSRTSGEGNQEKLANWGSPRKCVCVCTSLSHYVLLFLYIVFYS